MKYFHSNYSCTNKSGPYGREAVELFEINFGNVSDIVIDCPLQDTVGILDGLGVSGVSGRVNVSWCHMHVDHPVHGAFEPWLSLIYDYVICHRHSISVVLATFVRTTV